MKLGLIAMSGVRAHNPELTALGLTLPGFVERNKVIASLPSLGLLTLAGLTPSSIDTHYLEVPDIAAISGVPAEFDVVAISSFSAQIHEAYALADRYRALGAKVILGGLHVSAVPDEARIHADAIVVGEGEPVWP
ncbi:MAG: cobalamin-dependent protein, partial [Acidobacteriaceae bacterium]